MCSLLYHVYSTVSCVVYCIMCIILYHTGLHSPVSYLYSTVSYLYSTVSFVFYCIMCILLYHAGLYSTISYLYSIASYICILLYHVYSTVSYVYSTVSYMYSTVSCIYDLVPKGAQEKRTEVLENKVDRMWVSNSFFELWTVSHRTSS